MDTMVTPLHVLDCAALASTERVAPSMIDKCRWSAQLRLGWSTPEIESYFREYKRRARVDNLTVGEILTETFNKRGEYAAFVLFRTIWWLQHENEIKRRVKS
jgi:hypothetical protein